MSLWGHCHCPRQVVAVRRGFPSVEKDNHVRKRGRGRNQRTTCWSLGRSQSKLSLLQGRRDLGTAHVDLLRKMLLVKPHCLLSWRVCSSGWGGSSGQNSSLTQLPAWSPIASMYSDWMSERRMSRRVTNWLDCWASEEMVGSCCLSLGFHRGDSKVYCLCSWMMGQSQLLQAHQWHQAGE